jgi:AcrR family transcriptional regulator
MVDKSQKRTEILASARALFKENGFHETRVEDIALRAGVGKGTVYEYFKNKQEIFDETCVDFVKSIHNAVEEIRNMDASFKDKILLLYKKRVDSLYEEFDENPLDHIMSYKSIISDKVLITMIEYISDMNKIIVEIIDQGKEEGLVKKEIPSELVACFIVGTLGEYFNFKLYKKDKDFSDRDLLFDLLFNGFGVK